MSAIGSRINTLLLVLCFVTLLALVALSATRAFGGPLDPPSAPAPTDGVRDAGTPISSLPFTISAPGRYYVTRDLTSAATNQNGVTIAASDVTLDLHGFTLHGFLQGSDGVFVSGGQTNVRIENGSVRGWFNGIDAQTATASLISRVDVFDSGQFVGDGSYGLLIGADSVIENCNVRNGKASGIRLASGIIRDCVVTENGDDGLQAFGHAYVHSNQIIHNAKHASVYDIRLTGRGNYLAENEFNTELTDKSAQQSTTTIVRNVFCYVNSTGGFGQDDIVPYNPAAEFNTQGC